MKSHLASQPDVRSRTAEFSTPHESLGQAREPSREPERLPRYLRARLAATTASRQSAPAMPSVPVSEATPASMALPVMDLSMTEVVLSGSDVLAFANVLDPSAPVEPWVGSPPGLLLEPRCGDVGRPRAEAAREQIVERGPGTVAAIESPSPIEMDGGVMEAQAWSEDAADRSGAQSRTDSEETAEAQVAPAGELAVEGGRDGNAAVRELGGASGDGEASPPLEGASAPGVEGEFAVPGVDAPSETAVGADGAEGLGGEPTMATVRAQVRRRAEAIQVAPVTAGSGGAVLVRSTAVSRADLLRIRTQAVPGSARSALPSVPQGIPEALLTPQDPVPGARTLVEAKSRQSLGNQTLPGLTQSPFGNMPRMGEQPVMADDIRQAHRILDEGPPVCDPNDEARMRLLTIRERLLDRSTPREGKGEPVVLREAQPPERPLLTRHRRVQAVNAIARLLANKGQEARRMVSSARKSAYPNDALEGVSETANLGDAELVPPLEQTLDQQLHAIAVEAGIATEDLKKVVAERHLVLDERRRAEEERLQMSLPDARSTIGQAGQSQSDAVAGGRTWLETVTRAVQVGTSSPTPAIAAQRDALLDDVNRRVGRADARYRRAAETRGQELTRAEQAQRSAYQAVAQRDEFQLYENRGQRTDVSIREDVARTTSWLNVRLAFLRREFDRLKAEARDTSAGFRAELFTAGDQGREQIREWAATQMGEERGFWTRLVEKIEDWSNQARVSADAWEALQNQETAHAVSGDLAMVDRVQRAALAGISEQELLASNQLSAEEQAIVHAYFNPDPAEGGLDPIGAVAAGMRARIFSQRKSRLEGQIRDLLTRPEVLWQAIEKVARVAGNLRFDAAHLARELHASFHGGLTGLGTDEERAFRALTGLSPIETLALRKCYKVAYGEDLDEDISDELSGGELERARALISGDQVRADVATLYTAMHEVGWGTGAGTDEDIIMRTLRNKTPEEVEQITRLYRELYHRDLRADLRSELDDWATLTTHDADRADALLRSDTAAADAIAVDQQLHGFSWANAFNVTYGTSFQSDAREEVAAIYGQVREDVSAQADREHWTTAQIEAELTLRTQRISAKYLTLGGGTRGPLEEALNARFTGPSRDLVVALSKNDRTGADAARLAIERQSTFYASDQEMNRVLETQYDRALEDVRRDLAPERRRALLSELDDEEARDYRATGQRWTPAERFRRQQLVEFHLMAELEREARRRADGNMSSLSRRYSGKYGESVETALQVSTSGSARERAQTLLRQGGYLSRYQRFDYAVRGEGTREADAQRAISGASRAELDEMRDKWAREHRGETLDGRAFDELSGRDAMDMRIALMGAPETVEDRMRIERARIALEEPTNRFGGAVAGPEREFMRVRMAQLEADAARMYDTNLSLAERARLLDDFDFHAAAVQTAVEDHREAVSEITDSIANAVGMAVAIVVGAVGAIFTGGASAAVALAIIASLASTAASMGVRMVLMGNQYGHEEILMDLGLGVVDAVVGGLTAGMGNRLLGISQIGRALTPTVTRTGLRGAAQRLSIGMGKLLGRLGNTGSLTQATRSIAMLERMLQRGWFSRLAAHGIAQTMENAVQSLPSAVIGNVANDQTWESGNPLVNIASGTAQQLGHGLLVGLAMSGGHAVVGHSWGATKNFVRGPRLGGAPDVVSHEHLLTSPEAREAALREYQERNPGSSRSDFDALVSEQRRRHLEEFLAGGPRRIEADFDQMLQMERAARIAEYQQMHPGRSVADFDADLGRRSAQAHSEVAQAAKNTEAVRTHLEQALPENARALAHEVPVTTVSSAEMVRLTGSPHADAAVVVRDGQVHMVVREGATPESVREHAARLVDLVEPGTAGRVKEPALALPRDLRNRVPVHVNPKLEGGTVQVHYESNEGLILGVWIEVGPHARAVDIHHHVETARSMRKLQGTSGRVRRLLAEMRLWRRRNPRAGPGTLAWEAQLEVEKLPRIIEERARALRLATDPQERARISFEIELLRMQVEVHTATVHGMVRDPGVGYVAAEMPDAATVEARLSELPPEIREVLRSHGPLVEAYVAMYSARFRAILDLSEAGILAASDVNLHRAARFAGILQQLLGGPGATEMGARGVFPLSDTHLHIGGLLEPEHVVRRIKSAVEDAVRSGGEGQAQAELGRWLRAVEVLLSGREDGPKLTPQERARVKLAQEDARGSMREFRGVLEKALANPTQENQAMLEVARGDFARELQNVLSMPLADTQVAPLLDQFFPEFVRQKRFLLNSRLRTELVTMAVRDLLSHGVTMIELRQGLSKHVEAWFDAHPDAVQGLIVTQVKNHAADKRFIPRTLARIRKGKLGFVLGFDLSGLETGGRSKGTVGLREPYLRPFRQVHQHNQQQLTHLLGSHESLHTAVREHLASGSDLRFHLLLQSLGLPADTPPLRVAEVLNQAVKEGRMGPREMGVWNRVMREAIEQVGVNHKTNYLKPSAGFRGLLGITVHAGEQVRGHASLVSLLSDVSQVLESGTDRIGHGVILGTSFVAPGNPLRVNADLLKSLGFEQKGGEWVRGKGKGRERYSVDAILSMEQTRRRLLTQAVNLGVVIEINPTSNVMLSGLDPRAPHPVARMLRDEPALRVSVNTDNAGMHLTDPRMELAYLLATESLTYSQAVRVALEGFATRLGGRPLANALDMRQRMEDAIVLASRPGSERALVLEELARRYGGVVPVPGSNLDEGAFRRALQSYLKVILQ